MPDYTTLRGLDVPHLAASLARRIAHPRKRRKGRRPLPLRPASAKKNPVATVILTPDVTDSIAEGDWIPYTAGAKVDLENPSASSGQVIYKNKKGVAKVVSARRVAAWLNAAKFGHSLSQRAGKDKPLIPGIVRAERSTSSISNPRPRKKKMARKNPRHPSLSSVSLSTDAALNQVTDAYYPGTLWDYYEDGEMGPYKSSQPVNRRNPSHRKAHQGNAKLAMEYKNGYGISLKEAWAHVKAGTAPSHANPSKRPYWPRQAVYEQNIGPYNQPLPLPPNRRNPRKGAAKGPMIGRFPQACPICGESMKGAEIVQIGVGPRGGKKMAHVGCA